MEEQKKLNGGIAEGVGGRIDILDSRILAEGMIYEGVIEGIETVKSRRSPEGFKCYYLNGGSFTYLVPFFSLVSKVRYSPPEILVGKKVRLTVSNKKLILNPL